MIRELIFLALGYLSGSVLFARLAARSAKIDGAFPESADANPGAANAFRYGGFRCGTAALAGDLLKGFLPVFLFQRAGGDFGDFSLLKPFVLAAPVIGHAFPLFFGFHGGKGIAVSFGCLLGLLPAWQPVAILAGVFILFSTVLRISPHFYRTLAAYLAAPVGLLLLRYDAAVSYGFLWISLTVLIRLLRSPEARAPMTLTFPWSSRQ